MTTIFNSAVIFMLGELISLLMFAIVRKSFSDGAVFKRPDIQTFKGILERLVLFIGLINGFATVLVVFGALKLGTRLHDEKGPNHGPTNDYFIVGNFLSLLVAMVDTAIVTKIGTSSITVFGIVLN